ncbi:hypothetical protein I3843_06G004400 [Carya illinoinensis]|nr:hypothetical protein I3843_06G004400 [Carya illinoinensis]KAG7973594.1 hypothetical protein I3843_06G004400 [Carya illinoinensis]
MDLNKLYLNAPHSMGTTIIDVTYNGGVVLGADSRTSTAGHSQTISPWASSERQGKCYCFMCFFVCSIHQLDIVKQYLRGHLAKGKESATALCASLFALSISWT